MLWLQALVMWLIIALDQLCIYGDVALMAARARQWLHGSPAAGIVATRCVGALLVAAAMFTGFEGWQGLRA